MVEKLVTFIPFFIDGGYYLETGDKERVFSGIPCIIQKKLLFCFQAFYRIDDSSLNGLHTYGK